jgi:hypothetical protein
MVAQLPFVSLFLSPAGRYPYTHLIPSQFRYFDKSQSYPSYLPVLYWLAPYSRIWVVARLNDSVMPVSLTIWLRWLRDGCSHGIFRHACVASQFPYDRLKRQLLPCDFFGIMDMLFDTFFALQMNNPFLEPMQWLVLLLCKGQSGLWLLAEDSLELFKTSHPKTRYANLEVSQICQR